jgi:MFS family permease
MGARSPALLLASLTGLHVLNYVDRQLVVTLAPLLIEDLGLTRTQIGLLVGPVFVVFFAVLSAALGALADRVARPRLIAAGLGLWSATTALSGVASGFASLAALRALVGVGEASLTPAALSMLKERFPRGRLGFASSVYYAGIPLGFAISFGLAGWLGPWLGWRACFVLMGVAGLGAVAFAARLPAGSRATGAAPAGWHGGVRAILARPALVGLSLAAAGFSFTSSASQHTITWLVQERGLPYARAAFLSGLVVAIAGLAGGVAIGSLTDALHRRHPRGRLLGLAGLGLLALPCTAAFYTLPPSSPFFVPLWLLAQAWLLGWFGPLLAALGERAPADLAATTFGFALLTTNLLGVAIGPWLVGWLGDTVSLSFGLLASLATTVLGVLLVAAVALADPAPSQ